MLAAAGPEKRSDKSTQKIDFSYIMIVSRINLIYQLLFFVWLVLSSILYL